MEEERFEPTKVAIYLFRAGNTIDYEFQAKYKKLSSFSISSESSLCIQIIVSLDKFLFRQHLRCQPVPRRLTQC
jgi:hypothetical protein